ncbi:MAG: metal ABC transporter permease [Oscillospiraceae bacterium]|nr:metal ABC transporter permease [Oscillospiraceae bacterium]
MNLWYALWDALPFEIFHWRFMQNALLAILLMAPLLGLSSTMVVTGKMSFFSDALGHSAFTGIAIGAICGIHNPTIVSVLFAIFFSLLFSFLRSRRNLPADTLIGVFSSTAVALGIFIATLNGSSFTKFNKYLIGDILSVSPGEIGLLACALAVTLLFWILLSNQLLLSSIYPQLASSRRIPVQLIQTIFTTAIAVIVTLSISWVGLLILNSLLVLPAAAARNIAKNVKEYHSLSVIFALVAGLLGLFLSYYLGASAGAAISLVLAVLFALSTLLKRVRS